MKKEARSTFSRYKFQAKPMMLEGLGFRVFSKESPSSTLRRLIREYVAYHQEDRIQDALNKGAPNRRPDREPAISDGDRGLWPKARRSSSSIFVGLAA